VLTKVDQRLFEVLIFSQYRKIQEENTITCFKVKPQGQHHNYAMQFLDIERIYNKEFNYGWFNY
jgi:hypothetical protein